MSDTDGISDGYHTFGELYEHRSALLASIMREFPALSWMARQHHDGSSYPGWFIAGMQLPTGPISYHLRIDPWWNLLATTGATIRQNAPEWDGHTPADVVNRLVEWVGSPRTRWTHDQQRNR
jgi:hypothetical protein